EDPAAASRADTSGQRRVVTRRTPAAVVDVVLSPQPTRPAMLPSSTATAARKAPSMHDLQADVVSATGFASLRYPLASLRISFQRPCRAIAASSGSASPR